MPTLTHSNIGILICAHTGQRISLRTDEIQQHFDFAHAILAQLEAQEGVSTLPSTPLPDSADAVELAEWRRLKDPTVLHASLLRGLPARLTPDQLRHIAGDFADGAALQQPVQAAPDGWIDLIEWLLGKKGPFPTRNSATEGLYWWRKELRARYEKLAGAAPGEPGQ